MKLEEAKSILNSFGYFLTEKSEKNIVQQKKKEF